MGVTIAKDGYGTHVYDENGAQIASDCDGDILHFAKILLELRHSKRHGGAVAHIGGGLCCLIWMMGPGYVPTAYEIRPELSDFAPVGVPVVIGDWRDTISGTFDIIIYDLGGDVPYDRLRKHLNEGGLILPRENS